MRTFNINVFRKPYTVRRFGEQAVDEKGYVKKEEFEDMQMLLNVYPLSDNELQTLPEGQRTVRHIKSIGADRLQSSDENTGIKSDRLYYCGFWYECKSSIQYPVNFFSLAHFVSIFVILPPREQKKEGAPTL